MNLVSSFSPVTRGAVGKSTRSPKHRDKYFGVAPITFDGVALTMDSSKIYMRN